jgi:hypothetical protein
MKKLLTLTALLLAPAVVFAASFEGKVSFKMTSDGKPMDMNYSIKGDKIRMEMPGQKGMGGMIMDTGKKEMLMIMDKEKMYTVMAIPDAAEMKGKAGEDVKLEKTGEKEKILGYTAEKYISKEKDTVTELWLAEGLGAFMAFKNNNPMSGKPAAPQAWERALAGKELFPLRVVGRNKAGKETFRMETTAIEKQSLPDSLFAPPAGYERLDMGGMMQGMMKGMIPGVGR